jgi:hypothetical protein
MQAAALGQEDHMNVERTDTMSFSLTIASCHQA